MSGRVGTDTNNKGNKDAEGQIVDFDRKSKSLIACIVDEDYDGFVDSIHGLSELYIEGETASVKQYCGRLLQKDSEGRHIGHYIALNVAHEYLALSANSLSELIEDRSERCTSHEASIIHMCVCDFFFQKDDSGMSCSPLMYGVANGFMSFLNLSARIFDLCVSALNSKLPSENQKQMGFYINAQDKHGNSALHWSCYSSFPESCHFLLKRGSNQLLGNSEHSLPVHVAAMGGSLVCIQFCLDYWKTTGEHILLVQDARKWNSFWYAFLGDNPLRTVAFLSEKLSAVGYKDICMEIENQSDCDGNFLVHHCIEHGNVECLKFLKERGFSMEKRNAECLDGMTPLILSSKEGKYAMMEYLLSVNVDVNAQSLVEGATALHYACKMGSVEAVDALLATEKVDHSLRASSIVYTITVKTEEIESTNASPFVPKDGGVSTTENMIGFLPIHWASANGHIPIVRLLLTRADKMSVDTVSDYGCTCLHWAAVCGHSLLFKILVEDFNANLDIKDANGHTALHYVRGRSFEQQFSKFLEIGP
eukprot:Nk52_evm39s1020 gene=Nk52_evmTU39s1020